MRNASFIVPATMLIAAASSAPFLLWNRALADDKVATADAKWSYKVISANNAEQNGIDTQALVETLNELGEQGWECVGTISDVRGGFQRSNFTMGKVILKRRK